MNEREEYERCSLSTKEAYHRPRLVEYGSLRRLTTSGGGGVKDLGGSRHTFLFEPPKDQPKQK